MQLSTKEDVKKAETSDLVEFYNQKTGKSIKKFRDRETGENQVLKLIQTASPGKREVYENRIIQVIKEDNTKRIGTRAHRKFELLLSMNGKSISDFKALESKESSLDDEKGWPATELRWAIAKGFIKIA